MYLLHFILLVNDAVAYVLDSYVYDTIYDSLESMSHKSMWQGFYEDPTDFPLPQRYRICEYVYDSILYTSYQREEFKRWIDAEVWDSVEQGKKATSIYEGGVCHCGQAVEDDVEEVVQPGPWERVKNYISGFSARGAEEATAEHHNHPEGEGHNHPEGGPHSQAEGEGHHPEGGHHRHYEGEEVQGPEDLPPPGEMTRDAPRPNPEELPSPGQMTKDVPRGPADQMRAVMNDFRATHEDFDRADIREELDYIADDVHVLLEKLQADFPGRYEAAAQYVREAGATAWEIAQDFEYEDTEDLMNSLEALWATMRDILHDVRDLARGDKEYQAYIKDGMADVYEGLKYIHAAVVESGVAAGYHQNVQSQPQASAGEAYPVVYDEPYPASYESVEPYPASYESVEPYPASYESVEPYPASYESVEPYPASYESVEQYPASYESVEQYPASYESVEQYPASYESVEPYPASYQYPQEMVEPQPLIY